MLGLGVGLGLGLGLGLRLRFSTSASAASASALACAFCAADARLRSVASSFTWLGFGLGLGLGLASAAWQAPSPACGEETVSEGEAVDTKEEEGEEEGEQKEEEEGEEEGEEVQAEGSFTCFSVGCWSAIMATALRSALSAATTDCCTAVGAPLLRRGAGLPDRFRSFCARAITRTASSFFRSPRASFAMSCSNLSCRLLPCSCRLALRPRWIDILASRGAPSAPSG